MSDGLVLNFGVQRNEAYLRTWKLTDDDTGAALDITGWSFSLRFHTSADMPVTPALSIPTTSDPFDVDASSIRLVEATNGEVEIYIKQQDVEGLSGRAQDVRKFPYNLIVIDPTLVERALVRGTFTVEPGV